MSRFRVFCCVLAAALLASCATLKPPPRGPQEPSRLLAGRGIKSTAALSSFFLAFNPEANVYQVDRLADYYVAEGAVEGINSDVAFAQMCLETGFLRFGGLVTPDMHNYCGLGAIDADHPGERFPSEELGVRAHIQHLQAYTLTTPLRGDLIDPRYTYVQPRGKARDVWDLAGTWAADLAYGDKLDSLLSALARF
ncbi:MAG: glucosaminidase domain-containing protein [Spirochaetaceae bacterium]|jgi:hypothetical protein|nr:glucosaminidase domain-containing protein [Spirochaetaceae bacterium]